MLSLAPPPPPALQLPLLLSSHPVPSAALPLLLCHGQIMSFWPLCFLVPRKDILLLFFSRNHIIFLAFQLLSSESPTEYTRLGRRCGYGLVTRAPRRGSPGETSRGPQNEEELPSPSKATFALMFLRHCDSWD